MREREGRAGGRGPRARLRIRSAARRGICVNEPGRAIGDAPAICEAATTTSTTQHWSPFAHAPMRTRAPDGCVGPSRRRVTHHDRRLHCDGEGWWCLERTTRAGASRLFLLWALCCSVCVLCSRRALFSAKDRSDEVGSMRYCDWMVCVRVVMKGGGREGRQREKRRLRRRAQRERGGEEEDKRVPPSRFRPPHTTHTNPINTKQATSLALPTRASALFAPQTDNAQTTQRALPAFRFVVHTTASSLIDTPVPLSLARALPFAPADASAPSCS